MRKIRISLSKDSIEAGVRSLDEYRSGLKTKCDELCRRLGNLGIETAVSIVPIETGTLKNSISLVKHGDANYIVLADAENAAFVEFGTGVIGQGTYGFDLPVSWEYLQDPPQSPWAHDPSDISTWYYVDESGRVRSTRGQVGVGYMGAAAAEVYSKIASIAREVFS